MANYVTADAGSKIINSAAGTVVSAKDVEGGYFSVEKLDDIPDYAQVKGSLCYCQEDNKFYQYDEEGWQIVLGLTYRDITNFPTEKGISYPVNISQSFPFAENDSFIFPQYAKGMYIAAGGTDAVLFVTGHDGTSYSAYRSGETWQNPRKLLGTRDGNITISQSNTSEAYGLIQADNEVAFKGHSIDLSTKATTGEHARGIKWFNSDGSVFGAIGAHGTDGTLSDFYIGFTSEPWQPANSLKISADSIKWKGNELIHTGNASTSISKLSGAAPQTLTLDQTGDNPDASLAHNYIKYQINGVDKAASGYYKNMAFISNEAGNYARIGVNDSGEPQYWPGTEPTAAKTLIHSGNIGSQNVSHAATAADCTGSSATLTTKAATSAPSSTGVMEAITLPDISLSIGNQNFPAYSKGFYVAGAEDAAILTISPQSDAFIAYRSGGTWQNGHYLIHSGNIGSQSVNSAQTCTTATKLGTSTKGSTTKPIYLNSGSPTECSTYAGGTKVTVNGVDKGGNTAAIISPDNYGESGQLLISGGTTGPAWTSTIARHSTYGSSVLLNSVLNTVNGTFAIAAGYKTTTKTGQVVLGHYNQETAAGSNSGTTGNAFIIGMGSSETSANAFRVTYGGSVYAAVGSIGAGADYAEYFEWYDSNPNSEDRRGFFVTLKGEKIVIAEPNDYILGIISGQPAVIGNGDECWKGRYVLDDFGAYITENYEYEEEIPEKITDEETGDTSTIIKTVTKTGTKYKENPDYNPTLPYIQRSDRPEWDAVGMVGVLSVRDDGTCQVNGYCKVAAGGIATATDSDERYTYRVIERVNDHIIKVIFK